jgi:hypothetical protein
MNTIGIAQLFFAKNATRCTRVGSPAFSYFEKPNPSLHTLQFTEFSGANSLMVSFCMAPNPHTNSVDMLLLSKTVEFDLG